MLGGLRHAQAGRHKRKLPNVGSVIVGVNENIHSTKSCDQSINSTSEALLNTNASDVREEKLAGPEYYVAYSRWSRITFVIYGTLFYSFPIDDNDNDPTYKASRIELPREGPVCTFYIVKI